MKKTIIRRQYFNFIYSVIVAFALMVIPLYIFGDMSFSEYDPYDLIVVAVVFVMFMIPVVILSVLNRTSFGATVCTLIEKGVVYNAEKGGTKVIPWHQIKSMTFKMHNIGAIITEDDERRYAHVRIETCAKEDRIILHAPFYMLRQVKKYKGDIRLSIDKLLPLIYFGGAFLIGVIMAFFQNFHIDKSRI